MSATICGHERAALTYVLNVAASDHNNPTANPLQSWDVLRYRLGPNDVQVDYSTGLLINRGKRTDLDASVIAAKRVGAWFAIHDPAKLAELLVGGLQERGVDAQIRDNLGMSKDVELIPLPNKWCPNATPAIGVSSRRPKVEIDLIMPQARAALLCILGLPEGTRTEDAMKALVNNGV